MKCYHTFLGSAGLVAHPATVVVRFLMNTFPHNQVVNPVHQDHQVHQVLRVVMVLQVLLVLLVLRVLLVPPV